MEASGSTIDAAHHATSVSSHPQYALRLVSLLRGYELRSTLTDKTAGE